MLRLFFAIWKLVSVLNIKSHVFLKRFVYDVRGVTAIEYALIAVAVSAMLFIVMGSGDDGLIPKIKESFKSIQDALSVTKEQSSQ